MVEFDVSSGRLCSEHLEQLAIACPNLQRLNLRQKMSHDHDLGVHSTQCLISLRGLHAIANLCHNLQGLNLLNIPVNEVENQTQLWEILSGMKFTHLAVELCVLLPTVNDEQNLINLFSKCRRLQA